MKYLKYHFNFNVDTDGAWDTIDSIVKAANDELNIILDSGFYGLKGKKLKILILTMTG